MTTPTVVSVASTTAASANTITVNAPASLVVGNVLLAFIAQTQTATFTAPAGWTLHASSAPASGIWWKLVEAGEPASYTWTWTGTAGVSAGLIIQCSGVSLMPVDSGALTNSAGSANLTAASITLKKTGDLLLSFYCARSAQTITVPGSQTGIGAVVANSMSIVCGYESLTANGATGTRVATIPVSAGNCAGNVGLRDPQTLGAMLPLVLSPRVTTAPHFGRGGVALLGQSSYAFTGQYKVAGTAKQIGTEAPLYRAVRLLTMDGRVMRGDMTVDATGAYTFDNIPAGYYIVLGIDQNAAQNAVVAAHVAAVAM